MGEPEFNGVMARFIRTLKGQCIYLYSFRNLEAAQPRRIIEELIER
ncbi:MAG: hypothetical protein Q7W02_21675 [Candidatus Rokubacteria bacterium]|nr:hypothetical protein [Candidatus Rokubacteria bacterium]